MNFSDEGINKKSYYSGFRLIYRSVIDHPLLGFTKPYKKSEAWIWLLFSAWGDKDKNGEIEINKRLFSVKYGEMIYSIRYLSNAWGWGEKRTRLFLKKLEISKILTLKTTQQTTKISICNFSSYQNRGHSEGQTKGKLRANSGQIEGTNTNTLSYISRKHESVLPDSEKANPASPAETSRLFFYSWKNPQHRGEQFQGFAKVLGEELEKFCSYWTEPSRSGKRMRWEMEKTWELSRRIASWMSRRRIESGSNGKHSESYFDRQTREMAERRQKLVERLEREQAEEQAKHIEEKSDDPF